MRCNCVDAELFFFFSFHEYRRMGLFSASSLRQDKTGLKKFLEAALQIDGLVHLVRGGMYVGIRIGGKV